MTSSTSIWVVTREARYIHELSLTLEHSMPISSLTAPRLTGWWGKNLVTVLFYSGGGNTVNTQKANSQLPIAEKMGFSETFLFSKITFWKKKTLTSLDNYSAHLPSTGITF